MSLVGQALGPYTIVALVGQGAMAAVYRARHDALGREVALKVPHVSTRVQREDIARFRREGKLLASVKHPGIIEILDADEIDGVPFLAMTFIEAPTLETVLNACPDGRLPEARVRAIASSLLDALAAIHKGGILHRDLKPSNVFVELEDRIILADFGVARPMGEHTMITADGAAVGTFLYMAPEQHAEEPVDPRTDLYMVGLLMYRMLCGRLPFSGNMVQIMAAKCEKDELPSPRENAPEVSRGLETVMRRACARRAEERFATAEEFRTALQALSARPGDTLPSARPSAGALKRGVSTRDLPRVKKSGKVAGKSRLPATAIVGGAFALGVVGALVAVLVIRGRSSEGEGRWVHVADPVASASASAPAPSPVASRNVKPLRVRPDSRSSDLGAAQDQMEALWPGYQPLPLERDLARFPLKVTGDPQAREKLARELLARMGATLPEATMRRLAERGLLMPDFYPYMVPGSAPLKLDSKRMIVGSNTMIDDPLYDAVGKSTPQTALAMFLVGVARTCDLAVALRTGEKRPRGVTLLDLLTLVGYLAMTRPGFHAGAGERVYALFEPRPGDDRLTLDSWNVDDVSDKLRHMDTLCTGFFKDHPANTR